MFYANQHAANDVMKDFCRQKGPFKCVAFGGSAKGAAAQILHVWRGW